MSEMIAVCLVMQIILTVMVGVCIYFQLMIFKNLRLMMRPWLDGFKEDLSEIRDFIYESKKSDQDAVKAIEKMKQLKEIIR